MRRAPALIALCCAVVLTTGITTPAQAQTPADQSLKTIVASQIELNRRLAPLRMAADAAAGLGAGFEAAVYSGVVIDSDANTVTVYLTDRTAEPRFRRSMAAPGAASPGQLRFVTSRYTQRYLDAVREQLKEDAAQLGIVMIQVATEGSGITVTARDPQAARTGLATLHLAGKSAGSAPLSALNAAGALKIVAGNDVVPRNRTRDWAPWIAGEALSDWTVSESKVFRCTSGLPARRNTDGHPYLVTAAHCFADGVDVHTGWWNGGRTPIGRVSHRELEVDAAEIDTGATGTTGGREWDGYDNNINDVIGAGWSQKGDLVCQDGFASKIVCGIEVDDNATWTLAGTSVSGRLSHTRSGFPASLDGDSGGLVFNYNNIYRQARGIVSASPFGHPEQMLFPEAPRILSYFNLKMAPSAQ